MSNKEYMVCSSFGNDSIAVIQFMINRGYDFDVIYNNTGWAKDGWQDRVDTISQQLRLLGINVHQLASEGMEALVRRKKGWPMPASKMQFCTQALKEVPTVEFLNSIDPNCEITCVNGVRREESQNRAAVPEYVMESPKHGGRELWMPLYMHKEKERNELIAMFGIDVLPHSSKECHPCVCANKKDLDDLSGDEQRITFIENIEIDMGFTKNKKPRTMFRPYRVGGGVGIRQAVEWGKGPRGWKAAHVPEKYAYTNQKMVTADSDIAYDDDTKEGREFARQCDGGYCGI